MSFFSDVNKDTIYKFLTDNNYNEILVNESQRHLTFYFVKNKIKFDFDVMEDDDCAAFCQRLSWENVINSHEFNYYNDIYMPWPNTVNVLAAMKRRLNKFNKLQKKF